MGRTVMVLVQVRRRYVVLRHFAELSRCSLLGRGPFRPVVAPGEELRRQGKCLTSFDPILFKLVLLLPSLLTQLPVLEQIRGRTPTQWRRFRGHAQVDAV